MKAVSLVVVMTVGLLVCLSQQVLAASLTTADPQPTCPPGSICAYYTPPPPIRIFALGMCEEYTYEQMLNNEEQKCVNCYAQDGMGSCRCRGGQCIPLPIPYTPLPMGWVPVGAEVASVYPYPYPIPPYPWDGFL